MSPISDVTAFRAHYWKLDWFLKAVRLGVEHAVKTGGVYDFLAHPSCLVVEDPKFEAVKLICDVAKEAGDRAAVVGLDAIAARHARGAPRPGDEMRRHAISDADWDRIKNLLPDRGPKADNRLFVDAILWIARTGCPWRDLPERFGHWNSVWRRFRRWAGAGVWGRVLEHVRDPDVSTLVLDSTVVRAHPHAAGALKKNGPQALGRSRGGFGTKAHASVSGRGHPAVLKLTPGQAGDAPHAADLLAGATRGRVKAVIADRGYDSAALARRVRRVRARVVIPSQRSRKARRRYSKALYKGRNVVERFWNKLKQWRRVATRYDKLDVCYLGLIHLAATLVVLRHP
jgi:transposase